MLRKLLPIFPLIFATALCLLLFLIVMLMESGRPDSTGPWLPLLLIFSVCIAGLTVSKAYNAAGACGCGLGAMIGFLMLIALYVAFEITLRTIQRRG